MKIRVVGFLDQVVEVDADKYQKAKETNKLEEFMQAYWDKLSIEITFGEEDEFMQEPQVASWDDVSELTWDQMNNG